MTSFFFFKNPEILHIYCRNSDLKSFYELEYQSNLITLKEFNEQLKKINNNENNNNGANGNDNGENGSGNNDNGDNGDNENNLNISFNSNEIILSKGYYFLTLYVCELNEIIKKSLKYLNYEIIYQDLINLFYLTQQNNSLINENNLISLKFLIGIFQYYGLGCNQNYLESIEFLKSSADSNFILAQCCLGTYYYSQWLDTQQDEFSKLAFHYYTLSANQNYSIAQYNLGLCYENGCGIEINLLKSLYYYELSAKQGNASAQFHLGTIYENGDFNSLTKLENNVELRNLQLAFEYYESAAKNGLAIAQFNLGICYEYGLEDVLMKDYEKAAIWYTESAQQNHPPSQYTLGLFYEYGKGVDKNLITSMKWFESAALFGHIGAQFHCGWSYEFGQGVLTNINEAIRYYEMIEETNEMFYLKHMSSTSTSPSSERIYYTLNTDVPKELHEDSIHRALACRNLAICLETQLQNDEKICQKLLKRIYNLYILSEFLFDNDKRKLQPQDKKLRIKNMIIEW